MNKLIVAFALSLVGSALAGGAGPRPDAVFPLAAGQVWELTYQQTGGAVQQLSFQVIKEDRHSPDRQGVRSFEVAGKGMTQGAVAAFAEARYLIASAQEPFFMCLARRGVETVHQGYLLIGTRDEVGQLLPQRKPNDNYTDAEVYAVAKEAKLGTCTLKRLR